MPKSLAGALWQKDTATLAKAGVIARVEGTINVSLYYTAREFSIEYKISDEKLTSYLNSATIPKQRCLWDRLIKERICVFRYLRVPQGWGSRGKDVLQSVCLNIRRFSTMQSHESQSGYQTDR